MREVLGKHGLDPDRDLKVIGMGPRYPSVMELFQSGEVQSAVLSEPNVSIGEDAGAFRIMQGLTDAEFCPTHAMERDRRQPRHDPDEPELVRAVLRGCVRSYRYARDHVDELAAFGADYFGIARSTMMKSIRREAADLHADGEVDLRGLRQAIDLQLRLRAFANPMAVEDIVDLRFLPDRAPATV